MAAKKSAAKKRANARSTQAVSRKTKAKAKAKAKAKSKVKTQSKTTAAKKKTTVSKAKASTKKKAATRKATAKTKSSKAEPPAALPAAARRRAAADKPAAKPTSGTAAKRTTARKPARKKAFRWPTRDELVELPTEEVWALYRKVKDKKPLDKNRFELMRNALMELHYPLVRHIAERLLQTLPKSIELDDLISAGLFGLMDAIRGFDHERGIKFKTYCTTRIRGSILDQLRSQDWVPRLVRLKAGRIDKALHKLQGEYGREPTHAELAQFLELEHGELAKEIQSAHAKTMFSLSDKWEDQDENSSMEKVEILEDKTAEDPIGELNRRDVMVYITRSLTHKERFIIEQYYQVGHTMREIGEMLALTESRVCQIHSNVMGRLKGLIGPKVTSLQN